MPISSRSPTKARAEFLSDQKLAATKLWQMYYVKVFISVLAPGQMKTQKEAIALKLKIDQLRELQDETRKKAREAEMIREGIPLNRVEERGYKDRRFIRDDRGGGGRRDDRGGRDDRRGILYRGSYYCILQNYHILGGGRYDDRGGREHGGRSDHRGGDRRDSYGGGRDHGDGSRNRSRSPRRDHHHDGRRYLSYGPYDMAPRWHNVERLL